MTCLDELAHSLESKSDTTNFKTRNSKIKTIDLYQQNELLGQHSQDQDKFYRLPAIDPIARDKKPWKEDINYFNKCYISSLALMKMCTHAQTGGSIEIMGMLVGKILGHSIIVMDTYRLPVEGTETRVNAQNEAYTYMVEYLTERQQLLNGKNEENIVGWYHSHPGYGCWLSGIDVSTQSLNQGFQDPYLAIVVDPVKTLKQGKVEIGAFRTYPEGSQQQPSMTNKTRKDQNKPHNSGANANRKILPKSKQKDFGSHADKYYSLDIEIFTSSWDDKVIEMLKDEDSLTWMKNLLVDSNNNDKILGIRKDEIRSIELIKNYELILQGNHNADEGETIFDLIEQLKIQANTPKFMLDKLTTMKFDSNFESVLYKRLLKKTQKSTTTKKNRKELSTDIDDETMLDESDLEKNVGTGGIETSISSDDDDEEEEGEGEGNSSSRRDNNNNEVEEGPTDEVDSDYANEELLEEVGALENYNFNDLLENKSANKFLRSEQKIKHKNRPIHQRMDNSSMISEWNRLGHQQQHMPADYPYQWSSNVANLVKTSKTNRRRERLHRLQGASIDNKKQFELGLHGSPESKAKSANLVKLAKSIGLNEVFDLITLDAQQKLFG